MKCSKASKQRGISTIYLLNKVVILVFSLFSITVTNASLSTVTIGSIEGHVPEFSDSDLAGISKIGFYVQGTINEEFDTTTDKTKLLKFPPSLKYDDFVAKVTRNGFLAEDFSDPDGDAIANIELGDISLEWLDSRSNKLDNKVTAKNNMIACGASSVPAKLRVNVATLKVASTYGKPRDKLFSDISVTYDIGFLDGFCHAKPANMQVFGRRVEPDKDLGGGYNQLVFDKDRGFTTSHTPTFPTTAFNAAKFSFTMVYPNKNYQFSLLSGDGVTVYNDGNNKGTVEFFSQPTKPIVIKALNTTTNKSYEYSFSIDNDKWFFSPKGDARTEGKYNELAAGCAELGGTLAPSDFLSDAPRQEPNVGKTVATRDIGSSLISEWGNISTERTIDGNNIISGSYIRKGDNTIGFIYMYHITSDYVKSNGTDDYYIMVHPDSGLKTEHHIAHPGICHFDSKK